MAAFAVFVILVLLVAAPWLPQPSRLLPYPYAALQTRAALHRTVRIEAHDSRGYYLGHGTGVVVGPELVATCGHVIESAEFVRATTVAGREHAVAALVDTSITFDLALLRVPGLDADPASLRWHTPEPSAEHVALGYSQYAPGLEPDIARCTFQGTGPSGHLLYAGAVFGGFSGGGVFDAEWNLVGLVTGTSLGEVKRTHVIPSDQIRWLMTRARDEEVHAFPPPSRWPGLMRFALYRSVSEFPALRHVLHALVDISGADADPDHMILRVREDPLDPDPHRALLVQYLLQDEIDLAIREAGILDHLAPEDPLVTIMACLKLAFAGEFEMAAAMLTEEMPMFAQDGDWQGPILLLTGILAVRTEETGTAVAAYDRLRGIHPAYAEALLRVLYPRIVDLERAAPTAG